MQENKWARKEEFCQLRFLSSDVMVALHIGKVLFVTRKERLKESSHVINHVVY